MVDRCRRGEEDESMVILFGNFDQFPELCLTIDEFRPFHQYPRTKYQRFKQGHLLKDPESWVSTGIFVPLPICKILRVLSNSVSCRYSIRPFGVAHSIDKNGIYADFTQAACVRDPKSLKYHFKTYQDQTVRCIDLCRFEVHPKIVKSVSFSGFQKSVDISKEIK